MAKEKVLELTQSSFQELMKKERGLVIVDFFAEWCMPCVMMAPVLERLAEKNSKVKFAKINVDDARELADKYEISSIPCIIFFKDGKEIDRITGAVQEDILEDKIKKQGKF